MLICTAITRSESALQSKPTRDREGIETMRTMLGSSRVHVEFECDARARVPPRLSPDTTSRLSPDTTSLASLSGQHRFQLHEECGDLGMRLVSPL